MASHDEVGAMADALIEAGRLVETDGSPALKTAMRLALFILGCEIAERETRQRSEGGRPNKSVDPFARIIGKRQD